MQQYLLTAFDADNDEYIWLDDFYENDQEVIELAQSLIRAPDMEENIIERILILAVDFCQGCGGVAGPHASFRTVADIDRPATPLPENVIPFRRPQPRGLREAAR